ncbi:MAG TPA: peptidylprolyl isomerase [Candidatus Polarisedimenticolaceae bacterium]|nr:peptidylprolyl isomerase [Candidatus Polarisedimenticolaceae bacterium]
MRGHLAVPVLVLAAAAAHARLAPVVSPQEATAARAPGWYATVDTTLGAFTIRLLPEQAPQSVAHFVGFAQGTIEYTDPFTGNKVKAPLYDGLAIHRVTPAQRFEAGDPTGTGRGAPPWWVPSEPGPVDFNRPYRVGTTAAGGRRLSGSLFFVSAVSEPYLNGRHNAFGEVVEGRDVVDKICAVPVDENKVPKSPVLINKVTVFKVGEVPPIPPPVRYRPEQPIPEIREQELPSN